LKQLNFVRERDGQIARGKIISCRIAGAGHNAIRYSDFGGFVHSCVIGLIDVPEIKPAP